jgi:hypothetical protein
VSVEFLKDHAPSLRRRNRGYNDSLTSRRFPLRSWTAEAGKYSRVMVKGAPLMKNNAATVMPFPLLARTAYFPSPPCGATAPGRSVVNRPIRREGLSPTSATTFTGCCGASLNPHHFLYHSYPKEERVGGGQCLQVRTPRPNPLPVWRGEGVIFVRCGYQDAPISGPLIVNDL